MSKPEKLRVVLVEPGQYAREAEIDNTLEAKQAVVGGLIDVICPWPDDKVCLILNDEGKLIPLEPNRVLPEYEDIVFGVFFICGDDGEHFCSLTDRQVQRYLERFRQPEIIFDSPAGIVAMPCGPDQYARFMQAARGDGSGEPSPPERTHPITSKPQGRSHNGCAPTLFYKEKRMTHFYSAESVTGGHPDKLCDQIADTVLDGCLALDRNARVACEVLATKGHILLAGEISAAALPDVGKLARDALENAGYDPKDFEIQSLIHPQSPEIEAAINDPLDTRGDPDAIGAGDQCVVVGYATDETPEMLPLPVVLAHRLTSCLTLARLTGAVPGLGPDGKAMAVVEYEDDVPVRVARVVVSFQHAPDVAPAGLTEQVWQDVVLPALKGLPYDDSLELLINPGGRFVLGGPDADTGLTGRKLAVDAYGPFVPTGGGAFSGKDPTKLDRSGAYMARCVAKNIVASGLARRCQVTLTYAIGMAKPLAVEVNTFGTGLLCEDDCLAVAVQTTFDLTPAGIITELDLQRPIYARTAVGGHFGRDDLPWEKLDRTGLLMATLI